MIFVFGLLPSVFLLRKKQGTKEIRPITACPAGNLSFQLCLRVGSARVQLDEPHNSSMNYDPTKVEN